MSMTVVQAVESSRMKRVMRYPEHTAFVRTRPWAITPFLIAPVLPGETLKNLLHQAREITKPLKNGLIGWWAETYFFYVKHRDLADRDALTAMMLDQTRDNSGLNSVASSGWYHSGGSINWMEKCYKRIVEEWFRDDGEAWNNATITVNGVALSAAKLGKESWLDSLINNAAMPDVADVPEVASDLERSYQTWLFMRQQKMVEMDYEDWLKTYGVRTSKIELHKPELIRYLKEWTYPSNTVDPVSGAAVGAASWSIQERADKDRFFAEPGFVIGLKVFRPKVYYNKQTGFAAAWMNDAFSWLPAVMRDDPSTSLKEFANTAGPLGGNITDGYWIDIRDLLVYGDQYFNGGVADGFNQIALPDLLGNHKYATAAMADTLFISAVSPAQEIWSDSVTRLSVATREQDAT